MFAGALSYLFGVVTGIIFLVLDPFKQDRFVRFHAFQSIFFAVAWVGLWIVWTVFTGIFEAVTGGFLALMIIPVDCLLTLMGIAYWAFLVYRAYAGQQHKMACWLNSKQTSNTMEQGKNNQILLQWET